MDQINQYYLACAAVAALNVWFFILKPSFNKTSGTALPPGPRKLPLIGNLLDMPTGAIWETYAKWSKDCGSDIVHVSAVGMSIVILNSESVTLDLLEQRSTIYSSRPKFTMVSELMGWDFLMASMQYGNRWRAHRRLFHDQFNPTAVLRFRPQAIEASHMFLQLLLDAPEEFVSHIRHVAGYVMMLSTYGIKIQRKNDPYIKRAEEAFHSLSVGSVPGNFLVDTFPFLKYVPDWFPGAEFKRKAKRWNRMIQDMVEIPFADLKRNLSKGDAIPCYVSYCLENMDPEKDIEEQERIIKLTAGEMYAGAVDTTISPMCTFFFSMLQNPDAQRKAQAELDRVIPPGELPRFEDEESLPYITAIAKEVFRCGNVAPLAPHLNTSDDVYNGYHIPAGSVVLGNIWAILHDETSYPEPFKFNPDRYIRDGKLDPNVKDPIRAVFGYGRRVCPGKHMGYSSVWFNIASVLSVFRIEKAVDEMGKLVEPELEYSYGGICLPKPFRCSVRPRSNQAAQIIRSLGDIA